MQLNVLPHREIGRPTRETAGEVGDGAQLLGSKKAVGNPNAQHKKTQSAPLAVFAALPPLRRHPVCKRPTSESTCRSTLKGWNRSPRARSGEFLRGRPKD